MGTKENSPQHAHRIDFHCYQIKPMTEKTEIISKYNLHTEYRPLQNSPRSYKALVQMRSKGSVLLWGGHLALQQENPTKMAAHQSAAKRTKSHETETFNHS